MTHAELPMDWVDDDALGVEAPDEELTSPAAPPANVGLAGLLARARARMEEGRREAEAAKALHSNMTTPEERTAARELLHRLDTVRSWTATASVALVHVQDCTACGAVHEWFVGWFQEQTHRRFPATRRLLAGIAAANLPQRVERQFHGRWATCPRCLRALEATVSRQASLPFEEPKA